MRKIADWLDYSDSILATMCGSLILGTALIGGVMALCLIG